MARQLAQVPELFAVAAEQYLLITDAASVRSAAGPGAYYVVAEALTNAARHAQASAVSVRIEAADVVLLVAVRDDGAANWMGVPAAGTDAHVCGQ
jgi:signal transduction histidine kinase